MSVQTVVLGIASFVLPPRHRARWREEASAVLIEVSGVRRLWYTIDTVLKVPLLARQHHRGQAVGQSGRWISAVVGAALLASALALLAPLLSGIPRVPSGPVPVLAVTDPLAYLLALGGLFALVATRSFRFVRRPGGGLRYADSGAVLITVFAGAGPVVALPLSVVLNLPVVALVGNVLPGVWLAVICAMALRRRTGPWPLAAIGTVAGLALIGVLGSASLGNVMPGEAPPLVARVSTAVAVPAYLIWSIWAGVRLVLGRQDLLIARPPTTDGLRPGAA
jgi:hypothetical protein